jgi:hypothetical protein
MSGQERVIDDVCYVPVADAERMLKPLNLREARRLIKEQGVWPGAVRTITGYSPETCGKFPDLWIEKEAVENLARIFVKK